MVLITAEDWINELELMPHPEGGYYKQIYQCATMVSDSSRRSIATAIYYLLKAGDFSAFHRLDADEIWHYYAGSDLGLFIINNTSDKLEKIILGNKQEDLCAVPQVIVPKNTWFAAAPISTSGYSLIGATVHPGFVFDKFELATKKYLLAKYPQYAKLIDSLTRS